MNKIVEFLFQSGSNPVRNLILGGVQGQFSKKMPKKNSQGFSAYTHMRQQAKNVEFCK